MIGAHSHYIDVKIDLRVRDRGRKKSKPLKIHKAHQRRMLPREYPKNIKELEELTAGVPYHINLADLDTCGRHGNYRSTYLDVIALLVGDTLVLPAYRDAVTTFRRHFSFQLREWGGSTVDFRSFN